MSLYDRAWPGRLLLALDALESNLKLALTGQIDVLIRVEDSPPASDCPVEGGQGFSTRNTDRAWPRRATEFGPLVPLGNANDGDEHS